jgi:hypothetical protein
MRSTFLMIIILLPLLSCSQHSEKKKFVIDYQGKEMSEDEIQDFMKAEMERFESLNTATDVTVSKYDDVKKALPEWFTNNASDPRFQNIDTYNFEEKIIQPYFTGKISPEQFLSIIDTLNDELRRSIPYSFTKQYIPHLKQQPSILDKVLAIDRAQLKGENSFLIQCTQQQPGFQKALEDSIASDTFSSGKRYSNRGPYLSRYAAIGNNKATLALLTIAIDKMPAEGRLDSYKGNYLNAFEYLMLNGDDSIKKETRKLLFQYLTKGSMEAMGPVRGLLTGEISDELKTLSQLKRAGIDALTDADLKKNQESPFKEYYLKHYVRNLGAAALPYLEGLLTGKEDGDRYYAFPALREVAQYCKLTDSDKKSIVALMENVNQLKPGRYLNQCVDIVKILYPEKKLTDVTPLFSDPNGELEQYWNRPTFDVKNLDQYHDFLKAIGLDVKDLSGKDRYLFLKEHQGYNSEWLIFGLLNQVGKTLSYDCETGMWPNPYDELLQDYLDACSADLKNYYALYHYEKLNEDLDTKYTTLITDGSTGYLTNPRDAGDWYDPISVEALVNRALKDKGIDKRFMQLNTGDQTVFSVYCTPGQLKLLADKFGLGVPSDYTDR